MNLQGSLANNFASWNYYMMKPAASCLGSPQKQMSICMNDGYRNFALWDRAGEFLIRADSTWVYMNTETRRPERIDQETIDLYSQEKALDMEYMGRKIELPEGMTEYPAFPVRRVQIDTNGHVNNAKYIEMAEEWLPKDSEIKTLRVAYKHAAVHGDMIVPAVKKEENRHTVALKGPEGQVYAVIEASK